MNIIQKYHLPARYPNPMIPKHSINAGYKFSTPTDADEAFDKVTLEDSVDSNDASDNVALKDLLSISSIFYELFLIRILSVATHISNKTKFASFCW